MRDPFTWVDPFAADALLDAAEAAEAVMRNEAARFEADRRHAIARSRGLLTQSVRDAGHAATAAIRTADTIRAIRSIGS